MYPELTLILGGARSGKSSFAEKITVEYGSRVLYVATAQVKDKEMELRIQAHQKARPDTWRTLEAPANVGAAITTALESYPADVVLIDCLTLLVSNCILQSFPEYPTDEELEKVDEAEAQQRVTNELDHLLDAFHEHSVPLIIVSNELGLGLVPPYPLGRVYRDLLGWANQRLAEQAGRVFLLVAGLPLDLKKLSYNVTNNQ